MLYVCHNILIFAIIMKKSKIERALERTTDTKECLLGAGALNRSAEFFKKSFPGAVAIVVADKNTWAVAGRQVQEILESGGVDTCEPYIFDDKHFYAEWKFVEMLREHLAGVDAVAVAVGSGVINDLVKYVSGCLGRKYMCVGTAASMDGFTAFGASITKDGNKQTFSCPAPYAFLMDPVIAAAAPKELCASGYADLIAKIPAGADWMLADCVGAEAIDPFGWSLVQDGLRESLANPAAVRSGDVVMTEALCEGLLMSGFAMQAIQSSRPASGTEHQYSHCWDMENLSYPDGTHVSHGFKVGIGTLVSTASLEFLLEQDLNAIDTDACVAAWPSWEKMEADIRTLFEGKPGHLARALKESRDKYVDADGLRSQIEALKAAWPELRGKIRSQILPFDQVYESLKAVGAPYKSEMICVSREHLMQTFDYIPYMRSRFTNVDAIFRLGLLPSLKKRLFNDVILQ